jgi:hypothetical protein
MKMHRDVTLQEAVDHLAEKFADEAGTTTSTTTSRC